jgi:hypothetical protein
MNMMKRFHLLILLASAMLIWSCKKTPDYEPNPYTCKCGNVEWQGTSYDLLGANYILSDSTVADSRRYYVTADVAIEGETQTHSLSMWIEIDSLDGGGQFVIEPDGESQFKAWVDEFNLNDPIDELRQYIPVNAVISVAQAPSNGGDEKVFFQLTLNELLNGSPISGDINCSGEFTVYINQ